MTQADHQRRVGIIDGPSVWDLSLALFDDSDNYRRLFRRRIVTFAIEGEVGTNIQYRHHEVIINSVTRLGITDLGSQSWAFKALYDPSLSSHGFGGAKIEGQYSTATRKGWFKFSGQ